MRRRVGASVANELCRPLSKVVETSVRCSSVPSSAELVRALASQEIASRQVERGTAELAPRGL
jgi:hypothetical protein